MATPGLGPLAMGVAEAAPIVGCTAAGDALAEVEADATALAGCGGGGAEDFEVTASGTGEGDGSFVVDTLRRWELERGLRR